MSPLFCIKYFTYGQNLWPFFKWFNNRSGFIKIFSDCHYPMISYYDCPYSAIFKASWYAGCQFDSTRWNILYNNRVANNYFCLLNYLLKLGRYRNSQSVWTMTVNYSVSIRILINLPLCIAHSLLGLRLPIISLVLMLILTRSVVFILYLGISLGVIHIHIFSNLALWLPDTAVFKPKL